MADQQTHAEQQQQQVLQQQQQQQQQQVLQQQQQQQQAMQQQQTQQQQSTQQQQQQVQQQQQQPQEQAAQSQQTIQGQTQQACIQQISNWDPSRGQLQVIPSIPNNGPYLQYAPGQIIMPSANFAVQAATPHMFAQGKQVIATPGTPASFSGFTAVPTSTNNPQTIFISNLPNIIPPQSVAAVATSKQQDLQKYNTCATNRTVTQNAQPMQIPQQWQLQSVSPNMWAASSQPTFMTPTNTAVYFRGGNQQEEYNQNVTTLQLVSTPNAIKRPSDQLQPKLAVTRSILPSSPTIRAGSSVSTQTASGVQMAQIMKPPKQRPKRIVQTPAQQTAPITTATVQQVPQQMLQHPMIIQTSQAQQQVPGTVAGQQPMIIQTQPQQQGPTVVTAQQQQQQMILQASAQPQPQQQVQMQEQMIRTPIPHHVLQQRMIAVQTSTQPPQQAPSTVTVAQQQMPQQIIQLLPQKPVSSPSANTVTDATTAVVAEKQGLTNSDEAPSSASVSSLTPESGAVVEDSSKDKTLPKAFVKPNIITHFVNGHTVYESDQPFPVYEPHMPEAVRNERNTRPAADESTPQVPKRARVEQNTTSDDSPNGVANGMAETAPSTSAERALVDPTLPRTDPARWTVAEVFKFIKDLPGCSDYAEEFENQEIDGQALMLLKEDHLMSAMAMKLGPALKIVAQIDSMREEVPESRPPTNN